MDMSKYERAALFRKRIEHIDDVLSFLHGASAKGYGITAYVANCGVHSSVRSSVRFDEADVGRFIQTLERDKKELEEAFAAL
jgi:hypothetical protein